MFYILWIISELELTLDIIMVYECEYVMHFMNIAVIDGPHLIA